MANRFWVAGAGNWSDAANHWAASSGGSAGAGNLPGASDIAIFDASSGTGTVAIDGALNIAGVNLGQAGIVLDNTASNYAIAIGASNYTQTDGEFKPGSAVITLNGNWAQSGGTFTRGTSELLFNSTATTRTIVSTTGNGLYKLTINNTSSAYAVRLSSDVEIESTFTITKGQFYQTSGTSYTYAAKLSGNLIIGTLADVPTPFSTTGIFCHIEFVGSAAQTITTSGGRVISIKINKTNDTDTVDLSGSGDFDIAGGFIITKGTFNNTANNLKIVVYCSYTIDVSVDTSGGTLNMGTGKLVFSPYYNPRTLKMAAGNSLYDLEIKVESNYSGVMILGSDITVDNDFTLTRGGIYCTPSTDYLYSLKVKKNIYILRGVNGTVTGTQKELYLELIGTTDQYIYNNGNAGILSYWYFTLTPAALITAGTTYTNNGVTFTAVETTPAAQTNLILSCPFGSAPTASGTLTFVSGSPSGNLTFTSSAIESGQISGLKINKASGTAYLGGTNSTLLSLRGNLIISAGIFDNSINNTTIETYTSYAIAPTFKGVDLSGGTYIPGTSTLKIAMWYGTTNILKIGANALYDLIVTSSNGTNTLTLGDACTVTRNMQVLIAEFAPGAFNINIGGNLTIDPTTGIWTHSSSTGSVTFNGTGAQVLSTGGIDNSHDFAKLIINKSAGTLQLATYGLKITAAGFLTLTSGTLDANGQNIDCATTANFTIAAIAILKLTGDETISTPTITAGGQVIYTAAAGSRSIKNWTYSKIELAGAGTFVFDLAKTFLLFTSTASTPIIDVNAGITLTATQLNINGSSTYSLTIEATGTGAMTIRKKLTSTAGGIPKNRLVNTGGM